jgi:hypothetical protein
MSIIYFHKMLCRYVMAENIDNVKGARAKGTGRRRLSHTIQIFVICRDSKGIVESFSDRPASYAPCS